MISTFEALVVAVLAILPGASYTFAYERVAGSFGSGLADRVFRFFAASAVIHAFLGAFTYRIYISVILTGRLADGGVSWWEIELAAVIYVLLPTVCGSAIGSARNRGKRWARLITGNSHEPRAWDFLWRRQSAAVVRVRLKSGSWLAGLFAESADGLPSYASGYPESGDLFLSQQLQVDGRSGSFVLNDDNEVQLVESRSGLLIRWDEVEYLDYKEWK